MTAAFFVPGKAKLASRPVLPSLSRAPARSSSHTAGSRSRVAAQGLLGWLGMGNSESSSATAGHSSKGWQPSEEGAQRKFSASGFDVTPMTAAARNSAAQKLSGAVKYVCLSAGTERPFSGKTANGYPHDNKSDGVYVCALGGLPLFDSKTKFDSGTGWPSFYKPIDPEHVLEVSDSSIPFMARTEVVDARSGAHLGHVFNDGPRPTGLRYCMNAAAMDFIPRKEYEQQYSRQANGSRAEQ